VQLITVIPHYNSLDQLGDALFSIHNQSIKPNKIFIYDDFSTIVSKSDLINLIKKYKQEVELITLNKNIGQSNIRIKSLLSILKKFKGEIMIHYLDADDMIHHKFYEYSLRLYSNNNKVISYSYTSFSNLNEISLIKDIKFNSKLTDSFFLKQGSPSRNIIYFNDSKSFSIPENLKYRVRYEDWVFMSLFKKNNFEFKKSKMRLSFYRRILKYKSSTSNVVVPISELNKISNLIGSLCPEFEKKAKFLLILQEIKKLRFTFYSFIKSLF
jgi:hypothetical protein